MNSYEAKKVVVALQGALGLDPCTTPESEFRAELSAFADWFQDCNVHFSTPQTGSFQPPDGTKSPSITIMVVPDNVGNQPEAYVLALTYFGGDDSPTGPHHGISIVLNPAGQLLYRRLPGQDPVRQWTCNVLAHDEPNFKFPPYISDRSWMDYAAFSNLLQKHGIAKLLNLVDISGLVTEPTPLDYASSFTAEIAYLNYWNAEHHNAPYEARVGLEPDRDFENGQVTMTFICDRHDDIEPISLVYAYDQETDDYSLMIIDDDNIVYQREAGQDPLTEWVINGMANDPLITDESGNPLFIGDPIQE